MNILELVLGALACWRLAELLVYDEIFMDLKTNWFGIFYDETGQVLYVGPTGRWPHLREFIGELLTCVRCTSVWTGAFLVGLYLISPTIFLYFTIALAFSQTTILLNKYLT